MAVVIVPGIAIVDGRVEGRSTAGRRAD